MGFKPCVWKFLQNSVCSELEKVVSHLFHVKTSSIHSKWWHQQHYQQGHCTWKSMIWMCQSCPSQRCNLPELYCLCFYLRNWTSLSKLQRGHSLLENDDLATHIPWPYSWTFCSHTCGRTGWIPSINLYVSLLDKLLPKRWMII